MASRWSRRGVRMQSARKPWRHAACASAPPRKVLPTPVAPSTITFCFARTHWQVASERAKDLSTPRAESHTRSSMHAPFGTRASFKRRSSLLFSRAPHSRSTSIPIRSSVERSSAGGDVAISRRVVAIACSFMLSSFWIVSSLITVFLLVEVRSTADVVVVDGGAHRRLEERSALQAALQDRLHALEARAADGDGSRARRVHTLAPEAIGQANHAQACAVAGLGVGTARHQRGGELANVRTDALGPRDDSLRGPLSVLAVRPRTMFVGDRRRALRPVVAPVARDAHALVQDLHDAGG